MSRLCCLLYLLYSGTNKFACQPRRVISSGHYGRSKHESRFAEWTHRQCTSGDPPSADLRKESYRIKLHYEMRGLVRSRDVMYLFKTHSDGPRAQHEFVV